MDKEKQQSIVLHRERPYNVPCFFVKRFMCQRCVDPYKSFKDFIKSVMYGKKEEGNLFFRGVIYRRFLNYNTDQIALLSFPLFPLSHFASFETEIHRSFRNSLENCWQLLLLF